jgi:hypothetical protein
MKKPGTNNLSDSPLLLLKNASIFAGDDPLFQKLVLFLTLKEYSKGQVILAQDERVDKIAWIVKGTCSITAKFFADSADSSRKSMDSIKETEVQTQSNIVAGNHFPNFVDFEPQTLGFQVTADESTVLIASISMSDLKTFATDTVIAKLKACDAITMFSLDEIRQEFAIQQGWANHKSQVMKKLVNKKI